MRCKAAVEIDGARARVRCRFTNDGPARVYLLYLGMHSGQPHLYAYYLEKDVARIEFGLTPVDPADLVPGFVLAWRSRSAGEPVEPGATLEIGGELPLADPDVAHGGASSIPCTVKRFRVTVRYAVPPPEWSAPSSFWQRLTGRGVRPRRAPVRGYDLFGAPVHELHDWVELDREVPFLRSGARPGT